jgi:hypothetical protein
MAEAPRNGQTAGAGVPPISRALLAELAEPGPHTIRPTEVARGRRHAASRVFDDGEVVVEVASQLLLLSRS